LRDPGRRPTGSDPETRPKEPRPGSKVDVHGMGAAEIHLPRVSLSQSDEFKMRSLEKPEIQSPRREKTLKRHIKHIKHIRHIRLQREKL